jgi:hypothetical protein
MQGTVRQGVDGGFRDHQNGVALPYPAGPQTFFTSGSKAGEIRVLDFIAANPFTVDVGKKGVAERIDANAIGKTRIGEDRGRNAPGFL